MTRIFVAPACYWHALSQCIGSPGRSRKAASSIKRAVRAATAVCPSAHGLRLCCRSHFAQTRNVPPQKPPVFRRLLFDPLSRTARRDGTRVSARALLAIRHRLRRFRAVVWECGRGIPLRSNTEPRPKAKPRLRERSKARMHTVAGMPGAPRQGRQLARSADTTPTGSEKRRPLHS